MFFSFDYFTKFICLKSYLKYIVDKIFDIYKNYIFPIFEYNKAIYFNNNFYFVNQKITDYFYEKKVILSMELIKYLLFTKLHK